MLIFCPVKLKLIYIKGTDIYYCYWYFSHSILSAQLQGPITCKFRRFIIYIGVCGIRVCGFLICKFTCTSSTNEELFSPTNEDFASLCQEKADVLNTTMLYPGIHALSSLFSVDYSDSIVLRCKKAVPFLVIVIKINQNAKLLIRSEK